MPKYRVSVEWVMVADMIVEAENHHEAIEKAGDADMPEGSYLSDSWEARDAEEVKS